MKRKKRNCNNSEFKQLVINHINENINVYLKVLLIFIIGICIGITVVNQLPDIGKQSINNYITNSINTIKNNTEVSKLQILKSSLFKNIVIVLLIWFLGLTIFGGFFLYFITLIIGITFGYTLAAIMTYFTFIQGILFFFTGLFMQNIINIPSFLFLTVQGIKFSRSVISKKNSTIKYIIAKHSACSIVVMMFLVLASLIEAYVSGNLVYTIAKYL